MADLPRHRDLSGKLANSAERSPPPAAPTISFLRSFTQMPMAPLSTSYSQKTATKQANLPSSHRPAAQLRHAPWSEAGMTGSGPKLTSRRLLWARLGRLCLESATILTAVSGRGTPRHSQSCSLPISDRHGLRRWYGQWTIPLPCLGTLS